MKISSRMLQFNRPDLCKETILVRQVLRDKFQFRAKKTQSLTMEKIITTVIHLTVMMTELRQMLKLKKTLAPV